MFKTAKLDLTYLLKENYDKNMDKLLGQDTPVANLADVKQGKTLSLLSASIHDTVRIEYLLYLSGLNMMEGILN